MLIRERGTDVRDVLFDDLNLVRVRDIMRVTYFARKATALRTHFTHFLSSKY